MSVKDDQARLEKGVHVVVGTPGRVYDVIQRRILGGFQYIYTSTYL